MVPRACFAQVQGLEGGVFAGEGAEEVLHGAGSVEVVAGVSEVESMRNV